MNRSCKQLAQTDGIKKNSDETIISYGKKERQKVF